MLQAKIKVRSVARKQPTSFRFSEEMGSMLDDLERLLGINRTAVIEQAVRALYRRETGRKKPPEKEKDKA